MFKLLLAQGKLTEEVVQKIRSWKHSPPPPRLRRADGFSVDPNVRLEAGDQERTQRLMLYFLGFPFSQARRIQVSDEGRAIYTTGDNRFRRFAEAAVDDLMAGPKRNFEMFDPLDFLAACPAVASERSRKVTQHSPSPEGLRRDRHPGEWRPPVLYYGWYSDKNRGQRANAEPEAAVAEPQKSGEKPLASAASRAANGRPR